MPVSMCARNWVSAVRMRLLPLHYTQQSFSYARAHERAEPEKATDAPVCCNHRSDAILAVRLSS